MQWNPVRLTDGIKSVQRFSQPVMADIRFRTTAQPSSSSLKRSIDLMLGVVILLAIIPLLGLIAIAIMIDTRGPVLFRQKRSGLDGKEFTILKFRTMSHGKDAAAQAQRADPRITRVGRYLRRTSLDELPQIVNVLRGEMSLVGPRPHPIWLDNAFAPVVSGYSRRLRARPGITGLAQVNKCRGETRNPYAMERRVYLDNKYIDEWSLALDLWILVKTARVAWTDENAF